MPSNILVAGVDLDTLLLPIGANTPIVNVGIQVAGTDISQRYAPASAGSPYGVTGIRTSASGRLTDPDIGTLFAGTGSGPVTIVLNASSHHLFPGIDEYGFSQGGGWGSISPTTIKGYTISLLYTLVDITTNQSEDFFTIIASADPGASLFTTMVVGAKTRSFATATYTFSGGFANWSWSWPAASTGLFQAPALYNVQIT